MSRAFTKEIDDLPLAPVADRAISSATNKVTPSGAAQIESRLEAIERELADVSDAAAADELRREQRYWAARRASMQVIPPDVSAASVGFGVTVEIKRNGKVSRLIIVGEDEADPANGLISWTAPLAVALEGAEPGEGIEFSAGGRTEIIEVVAIAGERDKPARQPRRIR